MVSKQKVYNLHKAKGTTPALLIKNMPAQVNSVCSLTVSASDKNCPVFVWHHAFFVGIMLKLTFRSL